MIANWVAISGLAADTGRVKFMRTNPNASAGLGSCIGVSAGVSERVSLRTGVRTGRIRAAVAILGFSVSLGLLPT